MRRDAPDTATFTAVGIGAVTVIYCAGMPAIAGLVGAMALIIRARRGCPPGQDAGT